MTREVCPLYREVSEAKPWGKSGANAGLVFNKFASGWSRSSSWKFDDAQNNAGGWLKNFANRSAGEGELIKELAFRQRELVENLGGRVFAFKNSGRFVMGMGNAHPLENGLTWHPTLGVPYLPGSSLKGVLRSWDLQEFGEVNDKGQLKSRKEAARAFGTQGCIGDLIFFDLLPLKPLRLAREIMTPHYGEYYQNQKIPGDWESPVPIQYLAVEKDQEWQLGIAFQKRSCTDTSPAIWEEIETLVSEALVWAGAGAKTAIGFGRFDRNADAEKRGKQELENRKTRRLEELKLQEELAAREQEYLVMSEDLAELRRISDEKAWVDGDGTPNPEKFPIELAQYLESRETLSAEVVDWLRTLFEKRHLNLWKNPDETFGKKNKPVHKPTWVNLVKKVKAMKEPSP